MAWTASTSGLVVSPPALIKAQAVIDRGKLVDLQECLQAVISTARSLVTRMNPLLGLKTFQRSLSRF
jgi:hypothetical protein